MKLFKQLFKSKTSTTVFFTLLIGIFLIMIASGFVFSIYLSHHRYRTSRPKFAWDFVKVARLAQVIPMGEMRSHIHALRGNHFRVTLSNAQPKNSILIATNKPKQLYALAMQHHKNLFASIALSNGRYLNIRGKLADHPFYNAGLLAIIALLFLVTVFLCLYVVRRLSLPASKFIDAAKRFGVDVQSPPMAVTGPPEIQDIIKAFNEMQSRIRRLINDRTQMLAAISHDLRTPITRLQLRAEYLKDTAQYDKAVADLNEMEKMISSILSFARDYANTEVMERFDLNALLESLCDDLSDTGHAVTYDSSGERMPVLGRLLALKRAFTNMIENAVKYGDKAQVSIAPHNETLQIKINDEGPGIPENEMEKVFSPFYRVDPSRSPETSGSGLGLAVARDIIRAHGGDIQLFNREPTGLSVVVTLPLK